ncbi:Sec-independent protein translocase subunit TatA [Kitasatospora sp. NPDC048540]|uniref:Sec-independent protein translocase subunit TatA n=1 Tax=unclassified Kitasatospora TaxID=2633591 RepID=UPI000539AE57|nr:Sec-independent protein translocase subunit TatA [Kitasatospora sp. MBT63]
MLRNGLEPWHLLLLIAVVVLLFGSRRLPDIARSLGRSLRILKAETSVLREERGAATDDEQAAPANTGAADGGDGTSGPRGPEAG